MSATNIIADVVSEIIAYVKISQEILMIKEKIERLPYDALKSGCVGSRKWSAIGPTMF